MSESRGLEPVFMAVLYVALGAAGAWIYRDRLAAEANITTKDETIANITSATELLRDQLPNITRTVDKLDAINVEYRANAEVIKILASCVVPPELQRLSDESMAQINANADGGESTEAKAGVQGK